MKLSAVHFHAQFERFKEAIEDEDGRPFESFQKGIADEWEGYKQRVYREAREVLGWDNWKNTRIGTGAILEAAIAAIELPSNNLVQWLPKRGPNSRSHVGLLECRDDPGRRKRCEELLFQLYKGDQDNDQKLGEIFDALTGVIGRRYDVVAYFFFLLDWKRFASIAPTTFDLAFKALGLDVRTTKQCSWSNYLSYLAALNEVREALELEGLHARLVDAHSFCWMLERFVEPGKGPARRAKAIPMHELLSVSPATRAREGVEVGRGVSIDFVALNERRTILGRCAEEVALNAERQRLKDARRNDLAERVHSVADDTSRGYDLASFDEDGTPRQIEVKSVRDGKVVRFYLSENERAKSRSLPNYWFYFVLDAEGECPSVRMLRGGALPHEALQPAVYRASIEIT